MTQNKQTTTTKTSSKIKSKTSEVLALCKREQKELVVAEQRITSLTVAEDFRNSILIVSLLVNLFILTAWVTLQVTTQYDYAVSAFIFGR